MALIVVRGDGCGSFLCLWLKVVDGPRDSCDVKPSKINVFLQSSPNHYSSQEAIATVLRLLNHVLGKSKSPSLVRMCP